MVKPNNPYARPINATKETAVTVGEHYGQRATDKAINHAAGGRNVSSAARYQAVGNARVSATKAQPKPRPKTKSHSVRNGEATPVVTAEDLFG